MATQDNDIFWTSVSLCCHKYRSYNVFPMKTNLNGNCLKFEFLIPRTLLFLFLFLAINKVAALINILSIQTEQPSAFCLGKQRGS